MPRPTRGPTPEPRPDDELARRLDEIERRLERLEAAAGSIPPPQAEPKRPPFTSFSGAETTHRTTEGIDAAAAAPGSPPVAPPSVDRPASAPAASTPPIAPPASPPKTPPITVTTSPAPPPAKTPATSAASTAPSLERLVGGRWFAAIGAIIVVVGLALSLKLAWDAGYLRLSPTARVLGIAGVGVLLMLAGEVALRRLGRAASAAFFGAGVGSLFVAAYGAHALYELVGVGAAFALMAGACAVGIVAAVRAGLASIGVLSLLGAYLTPLLAPSPDASPLAMPLYLGALTVVGVALGWWKRRFGPVRALAWIATTIVGSIWVGFAVNDAPWLTLAFVLAVWGAYHADQARSVRPREPLEEPATDETAPKPHRAGEVLSLVGGVVLTAWAAIASWLILDHSALAPTWMAPAAMALASGLGSIVLAGLLTPMRELPRTPAERLGVLLLAQAGALLFTAVALALSGWVETVTWGVMGLAAIGAGRAARARALDVYGSVLIAFGAARALVFEPTVGGVLSPEYELLGLVLTPWSALLSAYAAIILVGARLVARDGGGWTVYARIGAAIALAFLCTALTHVDAEPRSMMYAVLALSVLASVFGRLERTLLVHRMTPFGALIALGFWSYAEIVPGWSAVDVVPLAHPGLWGALAIVALAWALGKLAAWPTEEAWRPAHLAPLAGGTALVFVATSFEVARSAERLLTDETVRAGAVSIWWGLFAAGLLVVGVARKIPGVRWAGLGLMLVAVVKAVVLDLAGVSPPVRVASFLGLGVLMIVVAAGYLRVARAAGRDPQSDPDPDPAADPDLVQAPAPDSSERPGEVP